MQDIILGYRIFVEINAKSIYWKNIVLFLN